MIRLDHFVRYNGKRDSGRWTVSQRTPVWRCKCKCGKTAFVGGNSLKSGNSTHCGCIKPDYHKTHGMTNHPLYRIWQGMKTRCSNPSRDFWHIYGGKGIKVCKRWMKFENFFKDMSAGWRRGLFLDRINGSLGYYRGNCRWSTVVESANNTECNVVLRVNGESKTVAQWARHFRISPYTIYNRIRSKFPPMQCISKHRLPRRWQRNPNHVQAT